jgi:DNA-binding transcriptional MerR regulator
MTIQDVAEKLQLPKSTIRFWEKEFSSLIQPQRTSGGQRRYSVKDMAVLEAIRDLKKSGLSLIQVKDRLTNRAKVDKGLDPVLIDQLADSIAGAVRREIYNLFRQER